MVRYFVSIEGHTHLSLSKSASWTKLVRTQALHISRGLPKHVHGASYVIADMLFLDREKRRRCTHSPVWIARSPLGQYQPLTTQARPLVY